jgi:hypothetical protein
MIVLLHCREEAINFIIGSVLKNGNPFSLNLVMFAPVIIGQGTPRQQAKWLQRTLNYNIIGTYAQVRSYGLATLDISDSCLYGKESCPCA